MLNIPQEQLPTEFRDEARIEYLYSPFRSQSVNPKDWHTKISSWKQLISLFCINNGIYSFTLLQLKKKCVRNGRPPSCLATVLEELLKTGELQYLEDFLKETPKSWSGWATDLLVKKPLSWSYNKVKRSLFSNENNPDRIYVHVEVIRQESQKILSSISENYTKRVINFSKFLKLINREIGQAEDVKLLLHYLKQHNQADTKYLKKGTDLNDLLVKFGEANGVVEITEIDISIYVLEKNEETLTKQIEDLEDQIAACVKQIKEHLLKGHKQLAKTCLKKKHEVEKRLNQKANTLHNVQVLLEKIKDAQNNAVVLQSYKEGLAAFNGTIKEGGLSEDAVEDTMLKLEEMLDIHEDIQGAISKPVIEEDTDFEKELAELMKPEEKSTTEDDSKELEEQLAKLDISDLPNPPSANVSVPEAL